MSARKHRPTGTHHRISDRRVPNKLTGWLGTYLSALQAEVSAIEAMGNDHVELDIRVRTRDRRLGEGYAMNRNRLIAELDANGLSEMEFCRRLGRGHSLSTMYRRMKLVPDEAWQRYLRLRRERGNDGHFSLEYAVHLASGASETSSRPTPTQSVSVTDDPNHLLIHGDALVELRKRLAKSVHCVVTSPPYWPARRLYVPDDPHQIGLEPTLEEYLHRVVTQIFGEVYRVLRDDGVCWVLLDDAISEKPYTYAKQSYHPNRSSLKESTETDVRTQDTSYLAPIGDWLDIPGRFARAMQAIGWHWRDTIIWNKGASGRKESTSSRCRRNFEFVLMFTKAPPGRYWYYPDPLRIPLSGNQPHSVVRGSARTRGWEDAGPRKDGLVKGYTTPGRHKDGTLRRDGDRNYRVFSNPLGRLCDAVWTIPPEGWRGVHSSAMPEQLARNCLLLTCPSDGIVLDPFGGSGTVSKVAKELGLRSISIDRHEPFVVEARQRLTATSEYDDGAANDNAPVVSAAD
jgi:DNA modification methylase